MAGAAGLAHGTVFEGRAGEVFACRLQSFAQEQETRGMVCQRDGFSAINDGVGRRDQRAAGPVARSFAAPRRARPHIPLADRRRAGRLGRDAQPGPLEGSPILSCSFSDSVIFSARQRPRRLLALSRSVNLICGIIVLRTSSCGCLDPHIRRSCR
jgi:hypothetical protein